MSPLEMAFPRSMNSCVDVATHSPLDLVIKALSKLSLAEAANDEPTADLLTQRLQIHEKTAWMLRSLLEN